MPMSTVPSKEQTTLPAHVRKKLGIRPNDRLAIETRGDTILITRAPNLFDLKGFLGKAVPEDQECERMPRAVSGHVKGVPA